MIEAKLAKQMIVLAMVSSVFSFGMDAVYYANIISKKGDPVYNNVTLVSSKLGNYTEFTEDVSSKSGLTQEKYLTDFSTDS